VPDKPSYLERIPAILEEARSPKPIPFFRRRDVEALFGLRRRQAINLMHRIGAIRVSSEIAIDQRDLIAWLEGVAASPELTREVARRSRVVDRIVELKAETAARSRKIVLPNPQPAADMPDGVRLEPGQLVVSFADEQELLQRLFGLARLIATNPSLISSLGKR
jgi:hypothetical protein